MADWQSHVAETVARGDKDRYLASLFVPAETRPHILALYAFNLEIASIRDRVSEALPGEMRLQWWRDAIAGGPGGAAGGHPTAEGLIETIDRFSLPRAAFDAMLEARTFDLYDDPMPSLADLEGYAGETASALFRLASLVLNAGEEAHSSDAAGHGGVAYALAGLLRALPVHARRNQLYLPADVLARHGASAQDVLSGNASPAFGAALEDLRGHARRHLATAEEALVGVAALARVAFLPLALVPAWLKGMEQPGYQPLHDPVEVPQWRRQWLLWRAARRLARTGLL